MGVLVENLEDAIRKWSLGTGYTFSEIGRYRTEFYSDHSNPRPHHHDARISFSKEGPPHIELMEFHGAGTHSAAQGEGIHHLGFMDHPRVEGVKTDLEAAGMRSDGVATDESGAILLWFTEKSDLHGIRLEFVSPVPQPIVMDDGSPAYRDARGFPSLWPPEPDTV
ncbi:VOC family protein [Streptomyces solincola]|uniref:VOC family protein n=1 Tax=Streptomyces solincola TaxID=2100817 RepID=UPI0015E30388|nr:VOC family protein [Streptomyces solincola]